NRPDAPCVRAARAAGGIVHDSARDSAATLELLHAAAAAGQPYTVAILDAHLPGADGLALARVVHVDPALAETCLVLLTTAGPGARDEETAAGIAATLTKPVRQSRLLATLARVAG